MINLNIPVVSVLCITFNHEKYIAHAIEGFLMQKTNFKFEIIIHDDASTDKTVEIIKAYQVKNVELFKCIFQTENLYSKKDGSIEKAIFSAPTGKYVAMCEGDDYWTDPLKLQKQVDFLEANTDYSMVCHNAKNIYEGTNKKSTLFSNKTASQDISMKTIIQDWVIPTASMVFIREYIVKLPEWFDKIYSGDFSLALLLRHNGKIWFFKEVMSVYRINYTGTSATSTFKDQGIFVATEHIRLLNYFNQYSAMKFNFLIKKRISFLQNEINFTTYKQMSLMKAFTKMPFAFTKKLFKKFFRLF